MLVVVGGAQAVPAVPAFTHVVVIVFENKEQNAVLGSRDAPTFNAMAKRYASLTRYYGVAHPSLPNYLALVSGSTQGITSDCTDCMVSARNLADTLARARKTWKVYAEGLPSPGFTGAFSGGYAKKHNPFVYFKDVVASRARLARVVPLPQLREDLKGDALPDFAFVVPNQCHSMHDCAVSVGDAWLRTALPPLLKLPDSVVFVVFDEGSSNTRGGGHVAALALGTAVQPAARSTAVTSHYGLLRTIESAWGLSLLGRSARATPITGIWR
ncbi:MAG: acid phosphatase [Actinobacteria bacterium]|nr:MAG: acid phosphatase [Actinomycetota bacterium]